MAHAPALPSYIDIQGAVGITKHNGGSRATDELLRLCHVAEAREILYVGTGIGPGPSYIAQRHPCRVVGVDISPRMIAWSTQRAREDGVADRTEFMVADVLALPFADNRFDAVIVESVLAFVPDKERAIRECIRVTRPGGHVGMNEGVWLDPLPPDVDDRLVRALGTHVLTKGQWVALWRSTGLNDVVTDSHRVDVAEETRSRVRWIGWRWLLRAWGRLAVLLLRDPVARASVRQQVGMPYSAMKSFGYVVSTGRK